jgi:hypothetical protein
MLNIYDKGCELSRAGYIRGLIDDGLQKLVEAPVPDRWQALTNELDDAKKKFLKHGATLMDRQDAIKRLGDVLESLRVQLKTVLNTKDESDLFNVLNNFAIRHSNDKQKTEYDKATFYSWIFYYLLASIQASIRLIDKKIPDA